MIFILNKLQPAIQKSKMNLCLLSTAPIKCMYIVNNTIIIVIMMFNIN